MEEYVLICDGTPAGILTAVYTAYEDKYPLPHTNIQIGQEGNLRLFASYTEVVSDEVKARKVHRSLRKRFGEHVTRALWYAMASPHPERGNAVFHTIVRGLSGDYRGYLLDYLQDSRVALVASLEKTIHNEIHHYYGFLRFRELQSGILYSEIAPKGRLLELLGDHFADRVPGENFVIRDTGREEYLIHPSGSEWYLTVGFAGETTPVYSDREEEIQALFRGFVHAIAIESRENRKLQRQMLPFRFRPYMVDFT